MNHDGYTVKELLSISNSVLTFYGTEAVLIVTILAFFWNNKKLSDHKKLLIISLIFSIIAIE